MNTGKKELFHAVSLSGGKDSTAMLILMVEKGMPIDAVLTADTGMEFPEMYKHLKKVDRYLYQHRGIHITYLCHPKGFEYMMFNDPKKRASTIETRKKLGVPLYGNGWPGLRVRWCTGQLKTHLIEKEINRLKGNRRLCSMLVLRQMKPTESKISDIRWLSGASMRRTHSKSAMSTALIGTGFTKSMTAVPAGAVLSNVSMNCAD